jgi:hypothetical protein
VDDAYDAVRQRIERILRGADPAAPADLFD